MNLALYTRENWRKKATQSSHGRGMRRRALMKDNDNLHTHERPCHIDHFTQGARDEFTDVRIGHGSQDLAWLRQAVLYFPTHVSLMAVPICCASIKQQSPYLDRPSFSSTSLDHVLVE